MNLDYRHFPICFSNLQVTYKIKRKKTDVNAKLEVWGMPTFSFQHLIIRKRSKKNNYVLETVSVPNASHV